MMRPASVVLPPMIRFVTPRRALGVIFALLFGVAAWAAPIDENQVIVPNATLPKSAPSGVAPTGSGALTMVAVLALAGVGAWLLWRGRTGGMAQFNRTARQLVIEETRSLGSRQYLVVATYQDRKFLLGVCPGRIDFLAPLSDATPAPEKLRS
jgi:flagellar protein FliO/FliZ